VLKDGEAEECRSRVGRHTQLPDIVDIEGLDDDEITVRTVAGRRPGSDEAGRAGIMTERQGAGR
jgi:hypothetical protein